MLQLQSGVLSVIPSAARNQVVRVRCWRAARRGRPLILAVDARGLADTGAVFYRSDNGVWLVDQVPPAYLRYVQRAGS